MTCSWILLASPRCAQRCCRRTLPASTTARVLVGRASQRSLASSGARLCIDAWTQATLTGVLAVSRRPWLARTAISSCATTILEVVRRLLYLASHCSHECLLRPTLTHTMHRQGEKRLRSLLSHTPEVRLPFFSHKALTQVFSSGRLSTRESPPQQHALPVRGWRPRCGRAEPLTCAKPTSSVSHEHGGTAPTCGGGGSAAHRQTLLRTLTRAVSLSRVPLLILTLRLRAHNRRRRSTCLQTSPPRRCWLLAIRLSLISFACLRNAP